MIMYRVILEAQFDLYLYHILPTFHNLKPTTATCNTMHKLVNMSRTACKYCPFSDDGSNCEISLNRHLLQKYLETHPEYLI